MPKYTEIFKYESEATKRVTEFDLKSGGYTGRGIPFLNNFYIVTLDLENYDLQVKTDFDAGTFSPKEDSTAGTETVYEKTTNNFFIPFQLMPDKITDSKNANYEDTPFIAGSSPLKTYQNSGARSIAFTLTYHVSPEEANPLTVEKLKIYVDRARSLVYPNYRTASIKPPTKCLVRLGGQASMIGVCRSVQVTYDGDKPWELGFASKPHTVSIAFVFEEVVPVPLSYQDIEMDEDTSKLDNPYEEELSKLQEKYLTSGGYSKSYSSVSTYQPSADMDKFRAELELKTNPSGPTSPTSRIIS